MFFFLISVLIQIIRKDQPTVRSKNVIHTGVTSFYPVENRKSCNAPKMSVLTLCVPSKLCTTCHWVFWAWIFNHAGVDEGFFLTFISDFSQLPYYFLF